MCGESARLVGDGVKDHLWPMVRDIKSLLLSNQTKVLTEENLQVLTAMLCSNSDDDTDKSKQIMATAPEANRALNNTIRTKINRLVLAILRVKPYQERMQLIYTHKYNYTGIEKGAIEKVPQEISEDTEGDCSITMPDEETELETQDVEPDIEVGATRSEATEPEPQDAVPDIEVAARKSEETGPEPQDIEPDVEGGEEGTAIDAEDITSQNESTKE